jgi:hypothetical protein
MVQSKGDGGGERAYSVIADLDAGMGERQAKVWVRARVHTTR